MAKVKMVLSWCIPVVLITVVLMVPAVCQAASIKIWPDKLKPLYPNNAYYQEGSMVCSGHFYVPLTLPAGARITKITYYYEGVNSESGTALDIYSIRVGNRAELLWHEHSTGSTSGEVIPANVAVTGDSVIRKGYRYYVRPYSYSLSSYFMGVKIDYQE